jgi:REP element-mobilizing transposase RayT
VVTVRTRGRLPHWEKADGIYFVTFRLFDSLPDAILQAVEFEREDIVRTARVMQRELSESEKERLTELFTDKIDTHLDSGSGACFLKNTRVAQMVADAIRHFDGNRYRCYAWCVMPNHVHAVFKPLAGHDLAGIVQSWKSFSAHEGNLILNRSGNFWQREYYDRLVRDEEDFFRVVRYTLENPAKAGLADWPYVGSSLGVA